MLQAEQTKSWILIVVAELFVKLANEGCAVGPPCHCDVYDDQQGDSPGRIASFEIAKSGKLGWWNWRTPEICSRTEWPLKLVIEFGEGDDLEHRTVWVQERSWALSRENPRVRLVG